MKYVNLTTHHPNFKGYPLAQRIDDLMHDGVNSTCINYIDIDTLRNQLGNVNDDQFNSAIQSLITHHDLNEIYYHDRIFFTIR